MQNCIICNKEFELDKWHPKAETCGAYKCCYTRQSQLRSIERAKRRPKWKYCEGCNKKIFLHKRDWHRVKWCSKCKKDAIRKASKKWSDAHPKQTTFRRWRNKWNGNWQKVMVRDNYICQLCEKKGTLIHHIDFSGELDDPNHSLNNLQVLCNSCHSQLHKPTIQIRIAEKEIYLSGLLFQVYSNYQVKILK